MFGTAALASAIVSVVAAGPVSAWPLVSPPEARFTVRMPGPVEERVDEIKTDLALVAQHTFSCSALQTLWQVSYVDLPYTLMIGKTPTQILTLGMGGSRIRAKDQVFSEGAGTIQGAPYKRYRVVPRVGPIVTNLLVLDGQRLYHLQVVSPPDKFRRVGANSFLESFALDR